MATVFVCGIIIAYQCGRKSKQLSLRWRKRDCSRSRMGSKNGRKNRRKKGQKRGRNYINYYYGLFLQYRKYGLNKPYLWVNKIFQTIKKCPEPVLYNFCKYGLFMRSIAFLNKPFFIKGAEKGQWLQNVNGSNRGVIPFF